MSGSFRISVDFDALSHDAKVWDDAAERLLAMSRATDDILLSTSTFSFAGRALADRYEELRTLAGKIAYDGTAAAHELAAVLRDLKRDYEERESENAEELRRLWRPVE